MKIFTVTNTKSSLEIEYEQELNELYEKKKFKKFIEKAILAKKNILISTEILTEKATFLNTCPKVIPSTERVITIEDARELSEI